MTAIQSIYAAIVANPNIGHKTLRRRFSNIRRELRNGSIRNLLNGGYIVVSKSKGTLATGRHYAATGRAPRDNAIRGFFMGDRQSRCTRPISDFAIPQTMAPMPALTPAPTIAASPAIEAQAMPTLPEVSIPLGDGSIARFTIPQAREAYVHLAGMFGG